MAITSIGYDGSIDEVAWAKFAPKLAARYWVEEGAWVPSAKPGASWTIRLTAGTGGGDGVRDTSDDVVEVALPSPTGAPWHVIYMDRTWAGAGGTSIFAHMPATADGNIPNDLIVAQNPGTHTKQPIALVQLIEGQTQPFQIIDLRVWQANGSAVAVSSKVTQYLFDVGTQITVDGIVWSRVLALGTPVWTSHQTTMSPIRMFGAGQILDGGGVPAVDGNNFKIQAGTQVRISDNSGYVRVQLPVAFPNGLLYASVHNGDDSAANDITMGVSGGVWGTGNKAWFAYRLWGPNGVGGRVILTGYGHRANYLAIGW